MEISLFSSESNIQYKKDIYNVIAAPQNALYRFRYKSKYIDESLLPDIKNNKLIGSQVLILYRSNSDQANVEPFMVPIRWGVIEETFFISEICIITFRVKNYPLFNQDFIDAAQNEQSNILFSKKFFEVNNRNEKYVLPIIPNVVNRIDSNSKDSEKGWISIIEALKHHKTFSKSVFYRTVLPKNDRESHPMTFELKEKDYKEIEIWHYCSDDTAICAADVEILCDPNLINPISGTKNKLECRYDRTKYAFQALKGGKGLKGQITFNIKTLDENDSPMKSEETKICIPTDIKKRWSSRIGRAVLSFAGSALISVVATFASLQTEMPLWICIVMLLTGSLFAAVNWLIGED